jgi:RNA polymerase sigma factor (sigma-70 family)
VKAAPVREAAWSDERLVRECRKGNQAAWSALIEKYKNLIFSIPVKFGLSRDDASDVFQAVCVDLLSSLQQLREPKALPKWLMQTSFHQCLRWKRDRLHLASDINELEGQHDHAAGELPEEMIMQIQREQKVREVMTALPDRCHRMVNMLFFEDPPRPYQEVARELGIATGSIGFIRGRCLTKMRQLLEKKGFR